jgi:hypothetical protein
VILRPDLRDAAMVALKTQPVRRDDPVEFMEWREID